MRETLDGHVVGVSQLFTLPLTQIWLDLRFQYSRVLPEMCAFWPGLCQYGSTVWYDEVGYGNKVRFLVQMHL